MQRYPVSADFNGGDEWSSPGLSFDDYARCHVQNRKQSGVRRLPTPKWAFNFSMQRELLVAYLEKRAYLKYIPHGLNRLTLLQRLARAQAVLVRRRPMFVERITELCKEYVAMKNAGRPAGVLRKREIQIELLDTRLRMEFKDDGGAGMIARIIHLYYSVSLDSVGTAQEMGIKPPHVRKILFELNKVAKELGWIDEDIEAARAGRKHRAPAPPRPTPAPRHPRGKLAARQDEIVAMYKAGCGLSEIARRIGTGQRPDGAGMRIGCIRSVLKRAGLR